MSHMLKLPDNKQKIVEKALDNLVEKTNMSVYRIIKKKLVMTFGEENVQITKIDEEYVHRRLREVGYTDANVSGIENNRFEVSIRTITAMYHIIVRVPELTIRNSRGNSTVIRDMFVRIQVHPDGRLYGTLEGVVTTFTKAQARMGYMHSHLHTTIRGLTNPPSFGGFCLGQGHITQVIALLQTKFDEVNFQMFCLHIRNFLEWESLEGVPYCRMGDIGESNANASLRLPVIPATTLSTISDMMRKEFYKLDPEVSKKLISIHPDTYEIYVEQTEDLEKWIAGTILLRQAAIVIMNIPLDILLAVKNNSGTYFRYTAESGNLSVSGQTVLNFRGEDIKIKIIDNEQNLKSTRYAHPQITEQLCRKLSTDLTRTALDYAHTGNNNTSEDKRETTDANNDIVWKAIQS